MNPISQAKIAATATALLLSLAACSSSNSDSSAQQAIAADASNVQPINVNVTVKRGTSNGTPTLVKTGVVTAQARIDAIDYDTRGIVLVGPEGHQEIFTVGPDVVNFNQLHKGDLVNCKFTEKLAVSVQKASDPVQDVDTGVIALPPIGDKPGIVASRSGQFTATVTTLDLSTRIVTLTGPDGNVVSYQVAPQAQGLENVHVGDLVVIGYSETVEIFVTTPS
jgi:hypothetical protein